MTAHVLCLGEEMPQSTVGWGRMAEFASTKQRLRSPTPDTRALKLPRGAAASQSVYDNIGLFSLNISSFIFLQKRKSVVLTMHKEANLVANEYVIMYEAIFVQLSHLQPEISDSSGSNKLSCSVS